MRMELVNVSNAPIGNEEQMAQVREMMKTKEVADEVKLGGEATDVIEVDFTSRESGERYQGKIKFKRPTMLEGLKIGGRKTRLLKEAGIVDVELADDGIITMAQAMATLETVVVKCPEWLIDLENVLDGDLIFHVYGRFMAWSYSFRLEGTRAQEEDSKTSE